MSMNKIEEPSTAPNPDQWYTLTLGSSFKDQQPSSKFCTLRYDFKPASIDKTQPGALHKTKDNKVSVEFNNNQPGKPKVTFEGNAGEDYKENDGVLFFDGHSFRLERLHHAVQRLRHNRLPGESSAASLAASSAADGGSSPVVRGGKPQAQPQPQHQPQAYNSRPAFTPPRPPPAPPVAVEVERIDIGDAGNSGGKPGVDKSATTPPQQSNVMASPDSKDFDLEEHLDIMNDDDDDDALGPVKDSAEEKAVPHTGIDINIPQQSDMDVEIADVDVNDDDGVDAAAVLRAQVNAVERVDHTSSSSGSSGSGSSGSSSGSGSGSSSSESDSSDGDSVNSI
ncbi:ELL-associated factor 1-like [Chenopodium quinoa]|uniref:ELL-associated factor 1-like n=1 Tax=Chenopodium quinoa TaxID=63459 RepID=UPI000B771E27|nr:ELL-associated factor 1-like [Chenopodium quinoa]